MSIEYFKIEYSSATFDENWQKLRKIQHQAKLLSKLQRMKIPSRYFNFYFCHNYFGDPNKNASLIS